MTWGDDIAAKMLGATMPAGFVQCAAMWEQPAAACPLTDLQTVKDVLGIPDASQDTEITRLIGVYSQAVEHFVERQLCEGAREVVYVPRNTCGLDVLMLPQHPVASVEHLDLDGTVWAQEELDKLIIDGRSGWLYSPNAGWYFSKYVHVKYTAGYNPIPPDLEDAVIQMINTALTSGASSGDVGPLKSQRVEGAVTETFYDARSSDSSSSSDSGAADVGKYATTLEYYRGERAFL